MTTPSLDINDQDHDGQRDLIKDTSTQDFSKDVLDASNDVPVLVDFWAPWCGPCQQLGPVLENLVKKAGGAVRLVKMNIDDHPEVAAQLGVKSIPAVFAFKNSRPVDGFMGALPESQVKSFIERIAGAGVTETFKDVLETGHSAYDEGDFETAIEVFTAVLGEDKENLGAIGGLAKSYIRTGELARAAEILELAPEAKKAADEIASARAMLDLAQKSQDAVDIDALQADSKANPEDYQSRYELAIALNARGQKGEALDYLLDIVRRNPDWNEEAARKQLIQFFDAWGPEDEMTIEGRRRLSSLMFA